MRIQFDYRSPRVVVFFFVMLSFFRKKSTTDVIDGIIPKMDPSKNANTEPATVAREALDSNVLVRQLGYTSLIDLKETIYGKIFHSVE